MAVNQSTIGARREGKEKKDSVTEAIYPKSPFPQEVTRTKRKKLMKASITYLVCCCRRAGFEYHF